jgi:hypothetical protein
MRVWEEGYPQALPHSPFTVPTRRGSNLRPLQPKYIVHCSSCSRASASSWRAAWVVARTCARPPSPLRLTRAFLSLSLAPSLLRPLSLTLPLPPSLSLPSLSPSLPLSNDPSLSLFLSLHLPLSLSLSLPPSLSSCSRASATSWRARRAACGVARTCARPLPSSGVFIERETVVERPWAADSCPCVVEAAFVFPVPQRQCGAVPVQRGSMG